MRQKRKRLGLCLLLVLTLLLGGCQTSAVKQEQASTETAAADTTEQKQETTEREDTKEPESSLNISRAHTTSSFVKRFISSTF